MGVVAINLVEFGSLFLVTENFRNFSKKEIDEETIEGLFVPKLEG